MKYLVCQKQEGAGCDYTIGCGMRFDFIEADSIQDVIEEVVYPNGRKNYCTIVDDQALEKILIIPAECVIAVDVESMAKEVEQQRAREAEETQKAKELAMYKRLQAKFGG